MVEPTIEEQREVRDHFDRSSHDRINDRHGDRANSDNNFEIIAERLRNLAENFDRHQAFVKEELEKTSKKLTDMTRTLDMAKGGYYVLAAAGAILIFLATYWTKIAKFFG